jgi:uncharacterized protein HemY
VIRDSSPLSRRLVGSDGCGVSGGTNQGRSVPDQGRRRERMSIITILIIIILVLLALYLFRRVF